MDITLNGLSADSITNIDPSTFLSLSADFTTDGLYLGEEFRLIEAPVPLVDDEAFPIPAEEDGEELKPGL